MVDHVFPVLLQKQGTDFACSETLNKCDYWSKQQPDECNQDKEEEGSQILESSWAHWTTSFTSEDETETKLM